MTTQKKTAPIIPRLLEYSEGRTWIDAKPEWQLINVQFVDIDDAQTCECGHYPILEICTIKNNLNGTVLDIGNCCINQISGEFEPLRRIFPALKPISGSLLPSAAMIWSIEISITSASTVTGSTALL